MGRMGRMGRMGQKWGKPYAIQCPLMPNGDLSSFVDKALQPLLFGVVGLFFVNTQAQSVCGRTSLRVLYSSGR